MSQPKLKPWMAFAILAVLALIPRIGIILSSRDHLYGRMIRDEPKVFIGEELARGNMAQDIIDGPLLPISGYQYAHFFGGSVVIGLLTIPSFLIFGSTLFALKLVPIGIHLVALLFLFLILDRYVSRRAAWLTGLLFALSPPGYTLLTTVCWGSHVESGALALASVYLFLRMHEEDEPSMRARFGWGLLAGFSTYFGYQCLVFIGALSIIDLARKRKLLISKQMGAQVLGFAIGFVPWLIYNLRNDFAGVSLYGKSLVDHMQSEPAKRGLAERYGELVSEDLPESFFFTDMWGVPGVTVEQAFGLFFALLILACAWTLRGRLALLVRGLVRGEAKCAIIHPGTAALVYLSLFLVFFGLSDFEIGKEPKDISRYRYAMPPFPFVLLATGVGLEFLLERVRRSTVPLAALTAAVAIVGTLGCLQFIDRSRFLADWDTPGFKRDTFGLWVTIRYCDRFDVLDDFIANAEAKRSVEHRDKIYEGMGKLMRGFTKRNVSPAQAKLHEQFEKTRAYLATQVPERFRHHFEGVQALR